MASSSSYNKYEIRRKIPDPKVAALLVIDMQKHFSSIAQPIIPSVTATVQICRRVGVPVFFTRHCHKSPADYGMLGEWWNGDIILDGTPASELLAEVGRREEEVVVEKNTYSAFANTRLQEMLEGEGVKEVIITGVMTNLCCETTARDAFVRGFRVFFSADGTATSDRELQEATLKNLAYGFAYLTDCDRLGFE